MSSGFLFALMFGVWIGNVVVVDGTAAACVETKIGNDEMKIDGCQSHAYGVSWAENRTLDFFFSADVTEHTKYDTQLGDRNCFLNVTSVKDNGKYVLSYRSYKAESGSFKLQLTADGKLQTGDNTVVCDNVPIESSSINHLSTVAYFSIAQGEIENFSVAIKAQDIAARAITQLLSTTTTVVSSSTSTAVPIGSTAEKEEKTNWLLALYIGLGVIGVLIVISAFFGLCYFLYRRNKKQQKREEAEAAQCNAKRIADYQAEQAKKAETKQKTLDQKKTAHNLRGKVVPGLPPPGPEGSEPDWIPPEKFTYMGPLKMELAPPVVMEHELDKASDKEPSADQPIVWADEMNLVYDIGSEVEQLTLHGKPFKMPKRSPAQPRAQNPSRRSAEANKLKAIREN